ncbi:MULTISPECIES: hypothetical protein [Streptomyces]|jgi:hypothetical protein|uniref:hypothetical protein n=1 Tax=Streptomyces TaxID=1883 RepID=UPI000747C4A3|nr:MULTISPECIES: hypothetical protein [Streptomyces]KUL72187.1 hypothetical protein ADL33_24095 [Streptomyces sp. NRRL WC-3604]KUL75963.1 hypothetical protein ADL34_13575 [Streptomyces sp. NRRL WC-3605]
MSAPTHTPPRPAATGRADTRLPWWALALPTLAFVTLLLLILNPSEAQAAQAEPGISLLLERVQQLVTR